MAAARGRRPTIADVAAAAGVSKMTVSLVINDRPGVSDSTRERIRAIVTDLGWQPNAVARSLAGSSSGAIALVLTRPVGTLSTDTFYMQLITGMQSELARSSTSLVLHIATDPAYEEAIYRLLAAERRVDAALITDVLAADPRGPLLAELGLAAVALGGPADGLPTLRSDVAGALAQVMDHLVQRGHRRVARIGGPARFHYTQARTAGFVGAAQDRGLRPVVVEGGETHEFGAKATAELLAGEESPTAFVYDNDLLALGGLAALTEAGIAVPEAAAVVSWDGSILAESVTPRMTTVRRDLLALGRAAAAEVLREAQGPARTGYLADGHDFSRPQLVEGATS